MCERSASPFHLLLDTGASSTTNVKMKKLHIIAGLLVIGLLAQSGLAKTKSRNGRRHRQAYLPPRGPSGPAITEEYITIHEEAAGGQTPFRESSYSDGKYQIFEIHSHYEPSASSGAGHSNFNAPGYLPPQQEIRVEHVHQGPSGGIDNHLNEAILDLGSNGARGSSQHAVPISAPAPVAPAVPVSFPSSYQHDFSNGQSASVSSSGSAGYAAPVKEQVIRIEHVHVSQLQGNGGHQTGFKAPDYLPPLGGNVAVSNPQPLGPLPAPEYRAPDYLPPHAEHNHLQQSQSHQTNFQSQHYEGDQFKGPDYLPPHQEHHTHNHAINVQQQQLHSFGPHQQASSYKGPDYLPPHAEHHDNHQAVRFPNGPLDQFKGPDYLPPEQEHHHETAHQHVEQHQHITQQISHGNQFKGPDYLPPHQEQHNQQHQVPHQQTSFNGPDYLPPHPQQNSHQHETPQHGPEQQNAYKGPDYLPPIQVPQGHNQQVQQQVQHQSNAFKGPDYLPPQQAQPHYDDSQQQVPHQSTGFKGPDYLPPHQAPQQHQHHHDVQQQVQHQSTAYKGPDYLPPHQAQQQPQPHHDVQQQVQHQSSAYKGPDYLPPHQTPQHHQHHHDVQQQVQHQSTAYKGPDYLPPHQAPPQPQPHHDVQQQVQHQSPAYKGPDYLPPHQGLPEQQHAHQQQNAFKGPDYLPPHQEHHVSHHHEAQQQVQHQPNAYRGTDYLPPHQAQNNAQHQQNAFRAPDYLPPHQEQHAPSGRPGSLPVGYEPQLPAVPVSQPISPPPVFQQPLPQPAPQHQHAISNLPQGYDFVKPANAEQAIAELHTLPDEHPVEREVVVQSQIQVQEGPQQADIIYGSQQSGANYQAKGYLPPQQIANNYQIQQGNVQAVTSSVATQQGVQQYQQGGLQQVAPQTFSPAPEQAPAPAPAAPAPQAPASNYLPPATPVQAQQFNSNLRSLSSYLNSVQPFQRYASAPRQPFREYGPPPATPNHGAIAQQQQQHQQLQPLPVAPMYREQASRPPHYAPAMSYATNAVANSYAVHHSTAQHATTFNHQTRQNLQQFMPSDVRHPSSAAIAAPAPAPVAPAAPQPAALHSAPAVPVRQSTSSKIRTVQIVNPAAVKTLKVLETSDHTGLKTIKILGPSNTQPTGEHHIVKVVTQNAPNAHEHVQTVKIFDDHEEVPSHGGGASGNAYLPPNARRSRQTPLKLQLLSNEKYRRPFTGRRRYRF